MNLKSSVQNVMLKNTQTHEPYAWMFWLCLVKEQELIIGIIKSSCVSEFNNFSVIYTWIKLSEQKQRPKTPSFNWT